jgi:hypothetical protein
LTASELTPTDSVESVENAVYIRNRLPDARAAIPFDNISGRVPSKSKLRPFGCLSYMLLDESKRNKLDFKFKTCMFACKL